MNGIFLVKLACCWFIYQIYCVLQHKNKIVNEELWNEAQTYGDIQLMPFVDYYSLITWKTLGICIFGVKYSFPFFLPFPENVQYSSF